jgi:hypothetical protein
LYTPPLQLWQIVQGKKVEQKLVVVEPFLPRLTAQLSGSEQGIYEVAAMMSVMSSVM